jgi:hypothetical protein
MPGGGTLHTRLEGSNELAMIAIRRRGFRCMTCREEYVDERRGPRYKDVEELRIHFGGHDFMWPEPECETRMIDECYVFGGNGRVTLPPEEVARVRKTEAALPDIRLPWLWDGRLPRTR